MSNDGDQRTRRHDGGTSRRRFLTGAGALCVAGIAGCTRRRAREGPAAGAPETATDTDGTDTAADTNVETPPGETAGSEFDTPLSFGESYEALGVEFRVESVELFEGFGVTEYCRGDITDSPVATATMTGDETLARIVVSIANASDRELGVEFQNFAARAGGEVIEDERFLGHSEKLPHPGANGLRDGHFGPSTATGQFPPHCFEVDGETMPNQDLESASYFGAGEEGAVWLYAVAPGNASADEFAVGLDPRGVYDVTPRLIDPPEDTPEREGWVWWMADPPATTSGTDDES